MPRAGAHLRVTAYARESRSWVAQGDKDGVAEGSRTPHLRSHNPVLYLMSYGHHCIRRPPEAEPTIPSVTGKLVGVERFELPTSCSQSRRATRLRYTPMN